MNQVVTFKVTFINMMTHDLPVTFDCTNEDTCWCLLLYSCSVCLSHSEALSVFRTVAVGVVITM